MISVSLGGVGIYEVYMLKVKERLQFWIAVE